MAFTSIALLTLLSAGQIAPPAPRSPSVCTALPPSQGRVIQVTPAQADRLPDIVSSAPAGSVILLASGVYRVNRGLTFRQPRVTLRGAAGQQGARGDRGAIIDGLNGFRPETASSDLDARVPELVNIGADDVTIADLTLRHVKYHLVHVQTAGHDTRRTKIYDVSLVDPGQQAVKINPIQQSGDYTDDGEIACSTIELTDEGRRSVERRFTDGCYTGGVDAHQSNGWKILNNTIKGFWCERGTSEHAIHMWTGSRDTVIEGNTIVNSMRGIGLGLERYDGTPSTYRRDYADGVCGGQQHMGHYRGIVRNNTILANDPRMGASQRGFVTGIGLEEVCDVTVANNTIISTIGFRSSAIEWRFPATRGVTVINNLTNGLLLAREGGVAIQKTNVVDAAGDWLVGVAGDGDLHLARAVPSVVGGGSAVDGLVTDKDGVPRPAPPDIGAYQYHR